MSLSLTTVLNRCIEIPQKPNLQTFLSTFPQQSFGDLAPIMSSSKTPYYLKALNTAKATKSRELDKETYDTLERASTDLWNRIIKNPNNYVMTREEYSLLNYYSTRYENNKIAKDAIARFWDHYKGQPDPSGSGPSSLSKPGRS